MSTKPEYDDDEAGSADKMVVPQLSEKALLATGIRIGTSVRTKTMEQFTARPRPDGLHAGPRRDRGHERPQVLRRHVRPVG